MYHKQFHNYDPANPLKCPHCDYWVGNRGKLTQHLKFHEATGIFGNRSSEDLGLVDVEEDEGGERDSLPPGISREQADFASLLDLSPAPRPEKIDSRSVNHLHAAAHERKAEVAQPASRKETHAGQPHLPPSKIHRQQIADSNLR